MAKRSLPESMRNAALLELMQPNLETGARRTGTYTLIGLVRQFQGDRSLCLEFIGHRSARVGWKVSSLPFYYSVQYSMERKSTKRRLHRP